MTKDWGCFCRHCDPQHSLSGWKAIDAFYGRRELDTFCRNQLELMQKVRDKDRRSSLETQKGNRTKGRRDGQYFHVVGNVPGCPQSPVGCSAPQPCWIATLQIRRRGYEPGAGRRVPL
jgi:hypothetical protein